MISTYKEKLKDIVQQGIAYTTGIDNFELLVASDVRRSSRILVQGYIWFDQQIIPARCNPTDFTSIGLQYQSDLTDF